jgi:hypothetical protein
MTITSGRLRQRLPPVRYANEHQTLESLGFSDVNSTYAGGKDSGAGSYIQRDFHFTKLV